MLKQLALYEIAKDHRAESVPEVGFLMESPRDPAEYTDDPEAPTFWDWPEVQNALEEPGMSLVTFDQGSVGHPQVKPTSCLTNLPMMTYLNGMRCKSNHGEELKSDLGERIKQTSSWSEWAAGLKKAIRTSLLVLAKGFGIEDGSLKKVWDRESWIQHFKQDHRPFRRDCRSCLMDMGSGKPHRRNLENGSSAWSMGVDIVQFPKTTDVITGNKVGYSMVATLLVPDFGKETENEIKNEKEGKEPDDETVSPRNGFLGEVLDASWGEGLEESDFPLDVEDVERIEPPEDLGKGDQEGDSGSPGMDDEIRRCSKPLKVRHVTVVFPMESRATSEVIQALDAVTLQFRSMGLPIWRLHSDKARELIAKPVQRWAMSRQILQTTTGGDNPASAGHVESEVNQLKRRVRLHLRQSGLGVESWPLALRYAAEDRKRGQLRILGTLAGQMIPFFSSVLVKRKRWHDRGLLASPFVAGTLLGPSPLMHHGWTVRLDDGNIVHVREAVVPSKLGDEVALQLQEDPVTPVPMDEVPDPTIPPHRLHGKQPMPGVSRAPQVIVPGSASSVDGPAIAAGGETTGENEGNGNEEENENENIFEEKGEETVAFEMPASSIARRKPLGSRKRETACVETEKIKRVETEKDVPKGLEDFGNELIGMVSSEVLEETLVKEHEHITRALEEFLNQVPIGCENGLLYGKGIQWLTQRRDGVERSLEELQALRKAPGCEENLGFRLCAISPEELSSGSEEEVLQTTVVSLEEVRRNIDGWKEAMMSEYRSLTEETRAIEPVTAETLEGQDVELVPGKLVCTLKAGPRGGRKKCRAVICGNLLDQETDPCPNSYASGADGLLIRSTVRHGIQQGWGISTTDVKTAFLLAPRPRDEGIREVVVIPPKVMIQSGVCQPNERWRVHRALYGFPSSPARWSLHRDATMKKFQWEKGTSVFTLQQTPEGNLWKIWESKGEVTSCVGHILVYVDDVMVISREEVRQGFLERLRREWSIATPETVDAENWVRFCGLEFRWEDSGRLHVAQPSYTKDLLERHQVTQVRSCPMPKWDVPVEPEEGVTGHEVKAAQAVTGELLWLSVRSRPDVSYSVSLMGRHVSKNPRWVVKVGQWVLEYLAGTPNRGLIYEPCRRDRGPDNNLPIVRHPELIEAYADNSFAPQGGRSCQGIVVFYGGGVVQWEATRQPFCAMSTAESELLGYCEALQVVQALESLLVILHGEDRFEKLLVGDNSSAISILTKPDGPWRTRHLRLRSHVLKERLADKRGDWKIRHQKGTELVADFLTKPITVSSEWERFARCLGMSLEIPPSGVSGSNGTKDGGTKESLRYDDDEDSASTAGRMAKLGVVLAAMSCAAECASGAALAMLKKVVAVFIVVWCSLARLASSDVNRDLWREVEKIGTRANEQQESLTLRRDQDAREENEPASGRQSRVKSEPDCLKMLREVNEPSISVGNEGRSIKGILRNPEVDPQGISEVGVERRVSFNDEISVVGARTVEDGLHLLRDVPGSNGSVEVYHCPSGCPISVSAAGPIAMDGSLRVAAMRMSLPSGGSGSELWDRAGFVRPPLVKKDCWEVAYLEQGWLVRSHGERRVRRFHPVHRGVPIDVSTLTGDRITIGFDENGVRSVVRDLWTDPPSNLFTPKRIWVGWTFLKVREGEVRSSGAMAYGGAMSSVDPLTAMDSGADSSSGLLSQLSIGGVQITFGDVESETKGGGKGHSVGPDQQCGSTGSSTGRAHDGAGYRMSSVAEKGKFVTDQLPLPSVDQGTFQEPSSGDEDWEKVDEDWDNW